MVARTDARIDVNTWTNVRTNGRTETCTPNSPMLTPMRQKRHHKKVVTLDENGGKSTKYIREVSLADLNFYRLAFELVL